jgi:hypothetical protein
VGMGNKGRGNILRIQEINVVLTDSFAVAGDGY